MTTLPPIFRTVAEDVEWLRDEWSCIDHDLTDAEIRRGSATLNRLIVDGGAGGAVAAAWHRLGCPDQPLIIAPDLEALARLRGHKLEHAIGVVAGGGRLKGVDMACLGAFRAFNPSTGAAPDADIGFAVESVTVARVASDDPQPSDFDALVQHPWRLFEYLASPSGVRLGNVISRQEIISYFANHAGGKHTGGVGRSARKKQPRYEMIAELSKVIADVKDGLHFELLSIGQALGRSAELHALAARIRAVL